MNFLPKLTPGNISVGLDIGSTSIKLVQLQQTRDGVALRKAGSAPTPEGTVKGGVVVDPLQVAKAIQSLLEAL